METDVIATIAAFHFSCAALGLFLYRRHLGRRLRATESLWIVAGGPLSLVAAGIAEWISRWLARNGR